MYYTNNIGGESTVPQLAFQMIMPSAMTAVIRLNIPGLGGAAEAEKGESNYELYLQAEGDTRLCRRHAVERKLAPEVMESWSNVYMSPNTSRRHR